MTFSMANSVAVTAANKSSTPRHGDESDVHLVCHMFLLLSRCSISFPRRAFQIRRRSSMPAQVNL
jgi:hypothetical protein